MKIGIVCEGITDFHAINHYIGSALLKRGIKTEFVPLQPLPDNTSGGGWGHVFSWLEQNPPGSREQLFGRGLFANSKKFSSFDSIVIHIDTDIIPDQSFLNYIKAKNFTIGATNTFDEKTSEANRIIDYFAQLNQCTPDQAKKHVSAPITESSEAWCIAIDPQFIGDAEGLCGQDLINAFGAALARFNKQIPKPSYGSINKKSKSREKYCQSTSTDVDRLKSCKQFVSLVDRLVLIAPQQV